ncbi:MAG: pyridoxal phosphate-dependent aminotransferase family protein [Mesorhizobium sp.]
MTSQRATLESFAQRMWRMTRMQELPADHPFLKPLETLQDNAARAGKQFVSFAQYDYLDLSGHPAVRQAAKDAIDEQGTGVGASRLVGGERIGHRMLERELAEFLGFDDALALISGYLTNESLIRTLMHGADAVFYDELSHNSIISGVNGGRYHSAAFPHNDLDALAAMLTARRGEFRNVLVIVEGLYSMDGDIPDLPRLLELKERHGFWLMVDEAHSHGVLGATGRGLAEHFGVDPRGIDVVVGTLSKTFVSAGGIIAGSQALIDLLRYSLGGFIYSVGLPPASVAAARKALAILRAEPERIAAMARNGKMFADICRTAGLSVGTAIGRGVVPVMLGDENTVYYASETLRAEGIQAPPILVIGVPRAGPRIRFFVTAAHSKQDMDRTVAVMARFK